MIALASAIASGCQGDAPPPLAGAPSAVVPAARLREPLRGPTASASSAAPPAPPRPASPRDREGETSVEALFDRAREALAASDEAVVVRCLEPAARRAWLGDALLALEVTAQDPLYQDDMSRRRALALLRERMVAHLVDPKRPAGRPPSLGAASVGDALLDRVDDPDALLAELLSVSRALGRPLDPVGAVEEGRVVSDPRRAAPPVPPPPRAGLARALRRIDTARDLAEVTLEDDHGIALVRATDGGLEPVRLARRGDTLWIDES